MANDRLKRKRILLVDDEPELLDMVVSILQEEGYLQIKTAKNTAEALAACREWNPEFSILTARGEDEDKFTGLGLGADDYMVKPFLPRELILRVHVILKRSYRNESNLVYLKACALDFDRAEIIRNGEHIALTAKEFELLQVLSRNAGRIVTIDMLCEAVWGDNPFGYENSLMAHIRRIREKIEENPSRPESLLTVKGLGYKLLMEDVR